MLVRATRRNDAKIMIGFAASCESVGPVGVWKRACLVLQSPRRTLSAPSASLELHFFISVTRIRTVCICICICARARYMYVCIRVRRSFVFLIFSMHLHCILRFLRVLCRQDSIGRRLRSPAINKSAFGRALDLSILK